jgi:NAD(P)H-hydrate epimerase
MTLSVKQARELDRRATADYGIPSLLLMESAGRELAKVVERSLISPIQMCNVAFVCGTGNNGGDGFAAARHLLRRGTASTVFLLGAESSLTPDAAVNFRIIQKLGIPVFPFDEFAKKRREWDRRPVLVVDAILGTGFKPPLRPAILQAIREIEDLKKNHTSSVRVVAVDIPSGLSGDDGPVAETAVPADLTVTFACNKPGLLLPEARPFAGRVEVIDIGIPPELVTKVAGV